MLKLNLATPIRKLFGEVAIDRFRVVTQQGEVEIYPGHARYYAALDSGVFCAVDTSGAETLGFISTGVMRVEEDTVTVFAEVAELKDEVDLQRARKAQLRSEELLGDASLDEGQYRKYSNKLKRSIARQSLMIP